VCEGRANAKGGHAKAGCKPGANDTVGHLGNAGCRGRFGRRLLGNCRFDAYSGGASVFGDAFGSGRGGK
jgi:hypothetical protein